MKYRVGFHIIPEGALVLGGPSQDAIVEADSPEEAIKIFQVQRPEAYISHAELVD
jgi:hypothetical protein